MRCTLPLKSGKAAALKCFIIFNLAAVVGFILGTAAFMISMAAFNNPTFSFLFSNCIGGLSHFASNHIMQRKKNEKFVKNFVVFNATGIAGFLISSLVFAITILLTQNSTIAWLSSQSSSLAWLSSSLFGTLTHFLLNDRAMKINLKRQSTF
jgi:predicted acyltransferase